MESRLPPRLIAITCAARFGEPATLEMVERICSCATPGTIAIQLRDRELPLRERFRLAERIRALTERFRQKLSVNDRADIAWLARADGVHLPESGVPAERVRALFAERGIGIWITRASHGEPPLPEADALLISPVFQARKGREPLTLIRFAELCRTSRVPLYALGGVTADHAASCLQVGGAGVAAIEAVYSNSAPLLRALGIDGR